ncbi:MAG TPA: penicillin-binding protein 2 [Coriobacteriia bacterium]|nr:penicillin-binding protein 2 [Coriobacteriia bacterium]
MTTFREQLKSRYVTLGVLILGVLAVLFVRSWSLQVLSGDRFAAAAEDNRVREVIVDAPRGRILDRNGDPLVQNRASLGVTVAAAARHDEELLYRLSVILDEPFDQVMERAASTREAPLEPRVVSVDVPIDVVARLAERESEFPGVEVAVIPVREYPRGMLAAHVLGYTGEISERALESPGMEAYSLGDIVGKAGAEYQFEAVLQGEKGHQRLEVDAMGAPRRVLDEAEPVEGSDVVLTIDTRVQEVAEEALRRAFADAREDDFPDATAGAAVALDVRTGEVLAMANLPTFDPGQFVGGISPEAWAALNSEESDYPLVNRTINALYPPASTFKVVTGLAGIEAGITSERHTYRCAGRWTGMGEQWAKYCWFRGGHGATGFSEGIARSCNVVFYEIGYEFHRRGREELQSYARRLGLGSKTGIDLSGEVDGRVPDAAWKEAFNIDYPEYQAWLPGDTVNVAIGQGDVLVTPLQLSQVYAAIATGGRVMRPHILREVRNSRGETLRTAEPTVAFDAELDRSARDDMHEALQEVVEYGSGASAFRGFPAAVAGKTGTAQMAGRDELAWFAGYAPADDPRYVVVVAVEQGGFGGAIAAPAARQIFAALLDLPVDHVDAADVSR